MERTLNQLKKEFEIIATAPRQINDFFFGDFLDAVEDLHRRDAREIEDQRHAQLGKGEDEDDGAAGKKAGHDQRQRDPPEPLEARAAKVFRCLLHRGIEIRHRGHEIEIENRIERDRFEHDDEPEASVAEEINR